MTAGGLPPELVERARAAAEPGFRPSAARDAATVVLARDAAGGPQVYLLRRARGMQFAGGMHAFPGGSVDPADAVASVAWAGPSPAEWAAAFRCEEPLARALVCSAIRETFEESGVLLAGASADEVLDDVSTPEWERERAALESHEQSLSELLHRHSLVLRSDLLRPLAHWITPETEPRRFDTRFFLAQVPDGQVCRDVGAEADKRFWLRPQEALEAGLGMLPPTAAVLRELAGATSVAELMAAEREISPVLPRFDVRPDGTVAILLPGDAGYR